MFIVDSITCECQAKGISILFAAIRSWYYVVKTTIQDDLLWNQDEEVGNGIVLVRVNSNV
jgi:hypothetical protein